MEKNIQNDRLDDYVKGSFDEYEENPAQDMWDRIAQQLPPSDERRPWWLVWRRYGWQLAAACVILALVSRLMCVQNYYEGKLRAVSVAQDQAITPDSMALPPSKPITIENKAAQAPTQASNDNNIPSRKPTSAAPENKHFNPLKTDKTLRQPAAEKNGKAGSIPALQEQAAVIPANNSTTSPSNEAERSPASIPSPGAKLAPWTALQALNITPGMPLHPIPAAAPKPVSTPTKKHQPFSGWYASIFITPHLMVEQSTARPARPGPMSMRPLYGNRQQHPQASADVSLRIGKKITAHFGWETGIGFQQFTRTAVHRPWFQYREGHLIQSGGAESRSFDYDLNTYGGSASVSLRTELSGNDTPAETERVGALITSREQIQVLRIPLLAVARWGHGRLQAVGKAGIQGSFLLKNQFEISAYNLENNKLRLRGNEGYTVQYNRPKHVIFGYQVSAGAEYRVNRHLSLAGAPTLLGDFPRSDPQRGKLPAHTMVGMNVGLSWQF